MAKGQNPYKVVSHHAVLKPHLLLNE
jgi:hypothetical protein